MLLSHSMTGSEQSNRNLGDSGKPERTEGLKLKLHSYFLLMLSDNDSESRVIFFSLESEEFSILFHSVEGSLISEMNSERDLVCYNFLAEN